MGEASVRRIYGDFTKGAPQGWENALLAEHAILPVQVNPNVKGKNASDIALVIDAMDLMHSGRLDGFVIVSSDSDYTRLAARLREHGMAAIGMGEDKTSPTLRNAFKRFVTVENLARPEVESPNPDNTRATDFNQAFQRIKNVLDTSTESDGWAKLGWLGHQLGLRYPDFDTRSYGCKQLSELISSIKKLELQGDGPDIRVRRETRQGVVCRTVLLIVPFIPRPEQIALRPGVSGNEINGLGERVFRRPDIVYWAKNPDDIPHGADAALVLPGQPAGRGDDHRAGRAAGDPGRAAGRSCQAIRWTSHLRRGPRGWVHLSRTASAR